MKHDEAILIGYADDPLIWVTRSGDVRDAPAAERFAVRTHGGAWRVVSTGYVRPTGVWESKREEAWEECDAGDPDARWAWRLADASVEIIENEWGEPVPNPHFDPSQQDASDHSSSP